MVMFKVDRGFDCVDKAVADYFTEAVPDRKERRRWEYCRGV